MTASDARRWASMTYVEARAAIDDGAIVVLPIGAVEQHGPHLPLDTDARLATTVAEGACERAAAAGVPAVVAPTVTVGYSPHHQAFAGTLTLSADAFMAVVIDISRSLWAQGCRKIVLLNGHGGNSALVRVAVQRLRFEEGVRAVALNYWDAALADVAAWRQSGPGGIDHACEMETALMMAVSPELVRGPLPADREWMPRSPHLSGDLAIGAPLAIAWTFDELALDGVLGSPSTATPERGRDLLERIETRVADVLVDVHRWAWSAPEEV